MGRKPIPPFNYNSCRRQAKQEQVLGWTFWWCITTMVWEAPQASSYKRNLPCPNIRENTLFNSDKSSAMLLDSVLHAMCSSGLTKITPLDDIWHNSHHDFEVGITASSTSMKFFQGSNSFSLLFTFLSDEPLGQIIHTFRGTSNSLATIIEAHASLYDPLIGAIMRRNSILSPDIRSKVEKEAYQDIHVIR